MRDLEEIVYAVSMGFVYLGGFGLLVALAVML